MIVNCLLYSSFCLVLAPGINSRHHALLSFLVHAIFGNCITCWGLYFRLCFVSLVPEGPFSAYKQNVLVSNDEPFSVSYMELIVAMFYKCYFWNNWIRKVVISMNHRVRVLSSVSSSNIMAVIHMSF